MGKTLGKKNQRWKTGKNKYKTREMRKEKSPQRCSRFSDVYNEYYTQLFAEKVAHFTNIVNFKKNTCLNMPKR